MMSNHLNYRLLDASGRDNGQMLWFIIKHYTFVQIALISGLLLVISSIILFIKYNRYNIPTVVLSCGIIVFTSGILFPIQTIRENNKTNSQLYYGYYTNDMHISSIKKDGKNSLVKVYQYDVYSNIKSTIEHENIEDKNVAKAILDQSSSVIELTNLFIDHNNIKENNSYQFKTIKGVRSSYNTPDSIEIDKLDDIDAHITNVKRIDASYK